MKNTITAAALDSESGERLWSAEIHTSIESKEAMIDELRGSLEGMMQRFGPDLKKWTQGPETTLSFTFRPGTQRRQNAADMAVGPSEAKTSRSCGRLSGPVQFVKKLLEDWRLEEKDAASLLGLEPSDLRYGADLLAGRTGIVGDNAKDRIACLLLIRATLDSLFRDKDVENDWLREPQAMLDDKEPMTLLLEGSMENLLLVKEYVEVVSGR